MKEVPVSIIVPVYNVAQYLPACLDSILHQTYGELEIIIVDDGSPDNCPAICDAYAAGDSRIKVIHKANGGLSSARNAGLDVATGDYILFVDSDDVIDAELVQKTLNAALQTGSDMVAFLLGDCENKTMSNEEVTAALWSKEEFWQRYYSDYHASCVNACTKLYHKSIFAELRFPIGLIHEDAYIITDVIDTVKKISFLDEVLYYYTVRQNSLSHIINVKQTIDRMKAKEKQADYFMKQERYDFAKRAVILGIQYAFPIAKSSVSAKDKKQVKQKVKSFKKYATRTVLREMTCRERLQVRLASYMPGVLLMLAGAYQWLKGKTNGKEKNKAEVY